METIAINEKTQEILEVVGVSVNEQSLSMSLLSESESGYLKDLKMNFKSILKSDYLTDKEIALLGLSAAANENNDKLMEYFTNRSKNSEASNEEIGEAVACASLLSSNNVLYRFRHFADKEKYHQLPARMRMNIMMKPVTGKEFFELMSLAVSAINGCEACVRSHENSLIKIGTSEERIFDAIKLATVVVGFTKIVR